MRSGHKFTSPKECPSALPSDVYDTNRRIKTLKTSSIDPVNSSIMCLAQVAAGSFQKF